MGNYSGAVSVFFVFLRGKRRKRRNHSDCTLGQLYKNRREGGARAMTGLVGGGGRGEGEEATICGFLRGTTKD